MSNRVSQREEASANVRLSPALILVADWLPQTLNSVARQERVCSIVVADAAKIVFKAVLRPPIFLHSLLGSIVTLADRSGEMGSVA